MKKKDWKSLLISKAEEDGAKCLRIYDKNIDDCDKIQRQDTCTAVCNCGEDFSKNIRQIVEISGLVCDKCTAINALKKVKTTNLERRGVEHPSQSQEVRDKFKETNLERYGVEYPSQSQEVKDKVKETNLERRSVEYPFQSQEVKDKIKETCFEKYGVENPLQSQEVKDKMKKTNLERYGVEYVSQSQEVKNKKKETCLLNFGVENPLQSQEVRDKMKGTCLEKYGVENPFQSQEVKDKIKETCFEKYGVEYPFQSQEVKDKMKETNLERRGVEYPFQSQEVKDKIKETNFEKYGVENPFQSQEVKDKIKATNFEKYGVEHPMQNREIFEKQQKNAKKLKEYIFASGETIHCQGDEPWALEELEELHGYTHDDYTNKTSFWYTHDEIPHRYHTDIEYLRKNKIIEVKSDYTFQQKLCINFLKANCVLKEGYDFEFWIYKDRKSVKIVIDRSRFELNNEIKHRRRG